MLLTAGAAETRPTGAPGLLIAEPIALRLMLAAFALRTGAAVTRLGLAVKAAVGPAEVAAVSLAEMTAVGLGEVAAVGLDEVATVGFGDGALALLAGAESLALIRTASA